MTLLLPASVPVTQARGVINAGIAGLGAAFPAKVVTNQDLAARGLDTSDEWIRTRTGIATRREAGPGETTTSLSIAAARAALSDAACDAAAVDMIIVGTTTADSEMPGVATRVAAALETDAGAFDVEAACAGFVTGVAVAVGLIAANISSTVLVIGADTFTRKLDPDDRATVPLFGDGAGAAVIQTGAGQLGPFDVGADGSATDLLFIDDYLRMNGPEVYRRAVIGMTESAQRTLDAAGLTIDDINLVVPHQANVRIIDAIARRLGVREDKVLTTIEHHGNTSAASIPLALAQAVADGRIQTGDRLLLVSFGAGLVWASTLLTWDPRGHLENDR